MRRRGFKMFVDSAGIPHKRGGMTSQVLAGIDNNGIVHWQRGGLINQTGYLKGTPTSQNPVNIIPSGHITTQGMNQPIYANGQLLHPDTGDYHFNTPYVVETKAKQRWGGKTPTAPKYLSIYPETQQPMKRSFRGRKPMKVGGQHFDPQLGNYMSNIYAFGGLSGVGYPYAGYNDSMRSMLSGMMQAGGPAPGMETLSRSMASGYGDHSALDRINGILTGRRMTATGNPDQDSLGMQAYLWRAQNQGRSPQETIQGFYGRPVSSSPADALRQRLSKMGYGPVASMYDTPDVTQHQQGFLWGGDVPDARNNHVTDGVRTGRVTTTRFPNDHPDEFGEHDWTSTPGGGYKKGGQHWIQGAINPAHKGYCTPMSKPTCTGRRKALAMLFKKKHGFHKAAVGGLIPGEYLQGSEFQVGGLTSFTPAGSMIDQNQWAMNPDGTSMASPSDNYRKSVTPGLAQTSSGMNDVTAGPAPSMGSAGIRSSTGFGTKRVNSFGTLNMNNLSMLLPANAALSAAGSMHSYNQLNNWRRQNLNNPLTTLGRDDSRPDEARYGYNNFQYGGINQQPRSNEGRMSFAGRPMKLWRHGGDIGDGGAAMQLRPYMLRQGRFQQGGDLLDQWDQEDAQDAQDQPQPQQQGDSFQTDNRDIQRRANLDDDEDYNNALQIAMEDRWTNPYW